MESAKALLARPHLNARTQRPPSYPERFPVPDGKVSWKTAFPEYDPPYFVDPVVLANDAAVRPKGWADPEDLDRITRPFNSLEGIVAFDERGRPLNPRGRTGICGRGLLGRWGANFAVDPILTRGAFPDGPFEVLVIQRHDSGLWAFPGGMIDGGESAADALARELFEETGLEADMRTAKTVYRGYVDGRRNTDNAWIESIAAHLHFEGTSGYELVPKAGDDAKSVAWWPFGSEGLKHLHDNHELFLRLAIESAKGEP